MAPCRLTTSAEPAFGESHRAPDGNPLRQLDEGNGPRDQHVCLRVDRPPACKFTRAYLPELEKSANYLVNAHLRISASYRSGPLFTLLLARQSHEIHPGDPNMPAAGIRFIQVHLPGSPALLPRFE
jgi:hypothetical protein